MEVDGPEQVIPKPSPISQIFRPPSPFRSNSYENIKRASFSSVVSSRRSSNTSRRRRIDAHRKSDASSYGDRRGSYPVVTFRPLDHPPGGLPQTTSLPNYDPRIYDQLSTFTFGSPGPSAPHSAKSTTFASANGPGPGNRLRSRSLTPADTDVSTDDLDDEEAIREERAKLRAMEDGSRRPSLPINVPPGSEQRRRSTVVRLSNGMDGVQMGNVPEEHSRDLTPLAQLPPKPLPALPLDPLHGVSSSSPFMQLTQRDLRGRFEPSVTPTNRDTSNANESDSNTDYSPRLEPWALDAPSPPNYGEGRDPSPGVMDSAAFQAVLDHEWGTAFHIPGNISPQSSIMEDPFMKMVEQLDPVFNRNRYAWTFKKIPTVKRPRPNETLRNAENDEDSSAQEKEGSKTPEKDQPEVITWGCQNVGQYGLWPGRTIANGEHRRPSVLYAISGEGGKRRGPTYLIHKHSRCHAFSIFQGYQVTGQKILASHAMLLSNKAIQYSFATSPEHKTSKKPQRPHEPYEDDPEVMKLQTHHLVEDDNDVPTTPPPRVRGHTIDASAGAGSPRPSPMRHTSATPERTLSRKGSNDVLRQMPRAGPASFAPVENPYPQAPAYAEPEGSTVTNSTITPIPKPTPHSVAFDAVDPTAIQHHQHQQALTRASSTRFEWFKRAFGTGKPVGTAPRYASHNGAPQQSIDSTYSPPWLLMSPQSVKQEEERIIQNLNDSFRAVGLIPPPKPRTPQPTPRARKTKPRSPILDSIPRDAMMMLMPLWIAEGGNAAGVSKHHVPMTERTYLLVYFVPFDSSLKSTDSGRGSSKKRTRRDRDRSERKKSIAIPSEGTVLSPTEEEDTVAESMVSDQTQKKPKKCSFRVVARMLSYADVRECGIKLPRFGLAVHGSLSDALLGNPTYHAVGENYSAVVAVCHGAEQGIELVTEGLDKLGLRKTAVSSADEQQIALAAMQMDREAMEEEHEARQQPLTPIGKSVVEMIFAGCTSILEIGFR